MSGSADAPTAPVEASGSERDDFCDALLALLFKRGLKVALDIEDVDALRRLALPPQPSGETREAVARVVDPKAWERFDRLPNGGYAEHVSRDQGIEWSMSLRPSLEAADRILALLSARPLALGGGGEVDEVDYDLPITDYTPSVAGLSDYLWNQEQAAESIESRCILEQWREAVDALSTTPARAEAHDEGAAGERYVGTIEVLEALRASGGETFHTKEQEWALKSAVAALRAHPSPPPAADEDRVRIDHLAVAEQIMATLQEEVSAFDAYGEDEINSLEANVAGIIQAALKSTAAKEGEGVQGDAAPDAG